MRLLEVMVSVFSFFWVSSTFAGGDCNKNSVITKDIFQCADASYKKIDKKLNEQYSMLIADPKFLNRDLLLEGERAWIRYRDVYCANIYESIFPGEEAGIEKIACLTALTSSRLVELLYLDTGVSGDGFYSSLSVMSKISSMTREEIFSYIESVEKYPEELDYYKKNCELTSAIYAEEEKICRVRMKFQAM
ncbi:lysozyme inhibitor LprI family protein [Pseudomonas sp. 18173]|uniref:lysozyme inhibitor LprI family protein n=1 Tax=Pseudomonas sp. 18173 TaxID=3390055 RepID=UPI003D23CC1B